MAGVTTVQHDAIAAVHAGLADVLRWLGETPTITYTPRHARQETEHDQRT